MALSTIRILLLLSLVVFVAGCTSIPLFPGLDVISVNKETSIEGERNVLVIKDKLTIPKSPVLTDQSVQFSFILENKDAAKMAGNILVDLFDAPLMKSKSKDGPLCNQPSGRGCRPEGAAGTILPGEQRQVTFNLFSPSQAQIGGLKTDLKLNFLVKYDFEGSTSFTVPVVNMEEIAARQRAGDKIKVDVIKSIGSGPIQVDPELFGSPFILAGQSGTFFFVIKNKGSGNLPLSRVPPQRLCIYFPKEFFDAETKLVTPDGIECTGPECATPTGSAIAKYVDEILAGRITGRAVEPGQGGSGLPPGCNCLHDGVSWKCTAECGSKAGAACPSGPSQCAETYQPEPQQPAQPAPSAADIYVECVDPRTGVSTCIIKSACPSPTGPDYSNYDSCTSALSAKKSLFTCVSVESAGDVECNAGAGFTNKILCYNSRDIELFRDESRVSMRFSIHKIKKIDDPFRSMTILTKIKYPYELRDSFETTVIPAKE